jgi:MFS family permease
VSRAEFYGVASEKVGLYLVPFAIGNFLGPITLGPLFDTIGRRQMIALTYSLSAVLLIITGTVRPPPSLPPSLLSSAAQLPAPPYRGSC